MKLSAVLLAGGQSRRFGSDKATVMFQGKPLWRRQLELLQSLAPIEILISSRTEPLWRPAEATFVADTAPSRGPLSGLVATLADMHGTHLLALAVDMPLMTATHVAKLCDAVRPGRGVLPGTGMRFEPLTAIYPRESYAHLSASLERGELSLQQVAGKLARDGMLSLLQLTEAEQELYRSINEPADLHSATVKAEAYPNER